MSLLLDKFPPTQQHLRSGIFGLVDYSSTELRFEHKAKVSVIVPVRITEDRYDITDRLQVLVLSDRNRPKDVVFICVDDGSEEEAAKELKEVCNRLSISYLRLNTQDYRFSAGRARNYGAMFSWSDYIFFQNVNLMPYDGFYTSLLEELKIQHLEDEITRFLMIPCVYLTESGAKKFRGENNILRGKMYYQKALEGKPEHIEQISTATSICLFERYYYLSRGGMRNEYENWGFEDLEFTSRAIYISRIFPTPDNWSKEKYSFHLTAFETWKATCRLMGDISWSKGLALYHSWHPVTLHSKYHSHRETNKELFLSHLKKLEKAGTNKLALNSVEPEALPDYYSGITLVFQDNCFTFNRDVRPFWGQVEYRNPEDFDSKDRFIRYVEENSITRVLFFNPYSSEDVEKIYHWCREESINLVVAERGALAGSVFYDPSGFLGDSSMYDRCNWDKEITLADIRSIECFVQRYRSEDKVLEAQGERLDKESFKRKYQIGNEKKILFVPLQRPSDTATKRMIRNTTYGDFLGILKMVSSSLPQDWMIAIKTHPLEDEQLSLDNTISVNDIHVHDLLEICDKILCFNSGVGLLAMLWRKRAILAGKAFYQFDEANSYVDSCHEIITLLERDDALHWGKVRRFLHYLTKEIYSFGEFMTSNTLLPSGDRITATHAIDFTHISLPGQKARALTSVKSKPAITAESILFDRYRTYMANKHNKQTQKKLNSEKKVIIWKELKNQLVDIAAIVSPSIINVFNTPHFVKTDVKTRGWKRHTNRRSTITTRVTTEFTEGFGINLSSYAEGSGVQMQKYKLSKDHFPEGYQYGLEVNTTDTQHVEWALLEWTLDIGSLKDIKKLYAVFVGSADTKAQGRFGTYATRKDGSSGFLEFLTVQLTPNRRVFQMEIIDPDYTNFDVSRYQTLKLIIGLPVRGQKTFIDYMSLYSSTL